MTYNNKIMNEICPTLRSENNRFKYMYFFATRDCMCLDLSLYSTPAVFWHKNGLSMQIHIALLIHKNECELLQIVSWCKYLTCTHTGENIICFFSWNSVQNCFEHFHFLNTFWKSENIFLINEEYLVCFLMLWISRKCG